MEYVPQYKPGDLVPRQPTFKDECLLMELESEEGFINIFENTDKNDIEKAIKAAMASPVTVKWWKAVIRATVSKAPHELDDEALDNLSKNAMIELLAFAVVHRYRNTTKKAEDGGDGKNSQPASGP